MQNGHVHTLVLLVLLFVPAVVSAQADPRLRTSRIVGTLVDADTGLPVEGVAVRIVDLDRLAGISNGEGRFVLREVPPGVYELEIAHIAYGTATQLVNVPAGDDVVIEARLRAAAIPLDSIAVRVDPGVAYLDRAGFYERQRRGFGYFFTGEDVESFRIERTLRSTPVLELRQIGLGTDVRALMRRDGRDCVPEIWLDGVLQTGAQGNVSLIVHGLDVAAMEVYRGLNTPMQFSRVMRSCGSILIWRRR